MLEPGVASRSISSTTRSRIPRRPWRRADNTGDVRSPGRGRQGMAAVDDPKTLGRTRLSFAAEHDIDEFADVLAQFERGEITPDQWRAFRLVRGTYGQRQAADAQMLRVKVPQGVISTAQLYAFADVAEQ